VIVRSDGTVTYVGKDIAYQLWKFGLLGKDFFYPVPHLPDGRVLWVTTGEPTGTAPQFGHASRVYNVIDARQSTMQDVVVAGLRGLGYTRGDQSVHFSYEMVVAVAAMLRGLGIRYPEEDRARPYVEVAGRKGRGRQGGRPLWTRSSPGAGGSGIAPRGSFPEERSRWPPRSPSALCATFC